MVVENVRRQDFAPRWHISRKMRRKIEADIAEWEEIDPAYARLCRQQLAAYDARQPRPALTPVVRFVWRDLRERLAFMARAGFEALRPRRVDLQRHELTQVIVTVPVENRQDIVLAAAKLLLARETARPRIPGDYSPPLPPSFFREGWEPGQRMTTFKAVD